MDTKQGIDPFDPERKNWGESEIFYVDYVNRLMDKKTNRSFGNGRPFHAVYLIYKFFMHAQREMRIFSGKLLRQVGSEGEVDAGMPIYERKEVLDAVKHFLSKEGASLKVMLSEKLDVDEGQKPEHHPLVKAILELNDQHKFKGSCKIRQLNEENVRNLDEFDVNRHLLLMDESAHRIEIDRDRFKAFVNMNDKQASGKMVHFFDKGLFHLGEPVWSKTGSTT